MSRKGCRLLDLRATCVLRVPGCRKDLFLKLKGSHNAAEYRKNRELAIVEETALEVLAGLAVPQRVELIPSQIPIIRDVQSRARSGSTASLTYVAETYEGESFHNHLQRLDPHRALGVWLFCTEQFVAFRRHQLLYTDIKCTNIVATRNPWKIVVVDFDHVVALVGRRRWGNFGFTRGFEPPELRTGSRPSEASAVYQLGMLLVHFLTKSGNHTLDHQRLGLPRVVRVLGRVQATSVAEVAIRCIAETPRDRFANFEEVYRALSCVSLPTKTLQIWCSLRSRYAVALAAVGLRAPK